MSHLRKVGIRAYRSITKANLRLGEVTVIIGHSDCGKSNVVRALRDWAFNVAGTSFITLGQQQARIAVAVGESCRVMFEKSVNNKKGASRYAVQDARTGESHSFEKVGLNVPPEVQDVTGIGEMDIDKDTRIRIQFAEQDDPWFLLSKSWSPGRVAKVVGKISGVDALILGQRDVMLERNSQRKVLKDATAVEESAQQALEGLSWAREARERLDSALVVERRLTGRKRSLATSQRHVVHLRGLRLRQAAVQGVYGALKQVCLEVDESGYLADLGRLREATARHREVERTTERLERVRAEHVAAKEQLTYAAKELKKAARAGGTECPLCGQGSHPGCLEGLAREAEEAAR